MGRRGQKALIALFAAILLCFTTAHFLMPDNDLSHAERRRLSKAPSFSVQALFSGDFAISVEEYMDDQFPMREGFRKLKALSEKYVFFRRDINGFFQLDSGIYKLEYPLKPKQVHLAVSKINAQIDAHPEAGKVYYSIIPDRAYFVARQNGYPSMDYGSMLDIMQESVKGIYIDIFDVLSLSDYYRTDSHWRQEAILPVAETLCKAMGAAYPSADAFTPVYVGDFRGVLAAQSALPVKPDKLYIMESNEIKNSLVTGAELDGTMPIYSSDKFTGMEPYDIYLSGAQAVITIDNPKTDTDKELVIFRDSFGSSLSPLLIGSYRSITLVDLRYIMGDRVSDYVDFEGADLLFLYSTTLLNTGGILR